MNRVRMPKPRNKDIFKGRHYMPNPKAKLKLRISSIMLIFVFALLYVIIQNTNNILAYFQSQDSITNEFDIQRRTITYEYYVYDENNNSSVLQASNTREILPTEVITLTPGGSLSNDNTYILKFDIENTEYNANDTYTMPNRDITIKENYYKREFKVHFDANGGTGTMSDQDFVYGTPQNLTANAFTNAGLVFVGWNTEPDGSGTHYANRAEFTITDVNTTTINLYAEWAPGIARIDTTYYQTLKAALESVRNNETKVVYLLTDTNETEITTKTGATIILDLQGNTLSNYSNNDKKAIIENSANLTIKNGTISNNGVQGTLNNNKNAIMYLEDLNINVSGKRQALYNNEGTATIASTVNITATGNTAERCLVQTVNGGTLNINGATIINNRNKSGSGDMREATVVIGGKNSQGNCRLNINGGTISSTYLEAIHCENSNGVTNISGNVNISCSASNYPAINNVNTAVTILDATITSTGANQNAINNASSLVIGNKDGNVSTSSPNIQGNGYGINNTGSGTVKFYDGIIRSSSETCISDEDTVTDIENDFELVHHVNTIDDVVYNEVYLGHDVITCNITLNANGGQLNTSHIVCNVGEPIGPLPTPTRNHYAFVGWYDAENGGNEVNASTVFNADDEIWAHWTLDANVIVNGVPYDTLTEALADIPANTPTTITLEENINECVTIDADKDIVLDLNGYTMSNSGVNEPIITNHGKVTTINGTLESTSGKGAIDNYEGGTLIVDGATIHSHGGRQALFNYGGAYMEIKGGAYLTSNATGNSMNDANNLDRATVNNLRDGTLVITDATIICTTQSAVTSVGTLTIGIPGGGISSTPVLQGNTNGVHANGTFNYYDGEIKGKTNAINATITNQESGTQVVNGTESIDGENYITAHLETTP